MYGIMLRMTTEVRARARVRKKKADFGPRPDIQGLRMVAVMLVVLSHLFGWPRGGFIGVDVFFVISGFLITGSLLHTQERYGRISFSNFYRRRIRRIVPVATLVLVVTVAASYLILTGSRAQSALVDGIASFFFVGNWRFAIQGTDYFTAQSAVSPLQHYWSLSVEEQFYFVWPVVILSIGLAVGARSGSRQTRLALTAGVMAVVVAASLAYSVYNTTTDPTWAYFSTFARVWELGAGALLAISVSYFDRIPDVARPALAWIGLSAIVVGAFAITEEGGGFPAPWAAVPVIGAALIIAAGVRGEHRYLPVLTNRASTYVGDISYSLYLWHWPVIILLGAFVDNELHLYAAAICIMFGLSVASYHFFENPIRHSSWLATTSERAENNSLRRSRWRLPTVKRMSRENQVLGTAALTLLTTGLAAIALVPAVTITPPSVSTAAVAPTDGATEYGPAQAELTADIVAAVEATSFPNLDPSMDSVVGGSQAPADVAACGNVQRLDPASCTWGSRAGKTIVILGDSVAMTYVEPLRRFAESSNGEWSVRSDAMFGCTFIDIPIRNQDATIADACPAHNRAAIEAVNETRPDLVLITNTYEPRVNADTASTITPNEWTEAMKRTVSALRGAGKVVLLSPPPSDINIGDCYDRLASPTDCLGRVTTQWSNVADAERSVGGGTVFVDSTSWFCAGGYCPSFVGATPTKVDKVHMTPQYAAVIAPAVAERLRGLGIV